MKRKISLYVLLIIFSLVCGACANGTKNADVSDGAFAEEIAILKTEYPDADFSVSGGKLTMSYNIDFDATTLPIKEICCDCITFDTLEQLKDTVDLSRHIVIRGSKVGNSTQICTFDSDMLCTNYYTNTPIKVLDVYYGDVEVGAEITLKEFAAVLTDMEGTEAIWTYGLDPIKSNTEYIFVLEKITRDPAKTENYYAYLSIGCGDFKIDKNAQTFESREKYLAASNHPYKGLMADFLESYYTKEKRPDVALDEAKECRKLLRYHISKNGGDNSSLAALCDNENASVEQLRAALSEEQTDLLDRMLQRYGKK